MDLGAIYIGDQLGLYRALAPRGAMTSAQLAAETVAHERYVREWLALHDMSRPVDVLRACGQLLAPGGSLLVVDERAADAFVAPGDQVERLMYGFCILCCLETGMADLPSAATGTVMRTDTLGRYAAEAGFRTTDVLSIANDFFRSTGCVRRRDGRTRRPAAGAGEAPDAT
jgi:Rv2258c-like winged HTH domain